MFTVKTIHVILPVQTRASSTQKPHCSLRKASQLTRRFLVFVPFFQKSYAPHVSFVLRSNGSHLAGEINTGVRIVNQTETASDARC